MDPTRHEKEKGQGLTFHLLLLGCLTLAGAIVLTFAWGGPLGAGRVEVVGQSETQDQDTESSPPDLVTGEGVVPVAPDEDGVASDPADDGKPDVAAACDMFRNGATVDDFANRFEVAVGTVGPDEERLFREIIVAALTEVCPDVIPNRGR